MKLAPYTKLITGIVNKNEMDSKEYIKNIVSISCCVNSLKSKQDVLEEELKKLMQSTIKCEHCEWEGRICQTNLLNSSWNDSYQIVLICPSCSGDFNKYEFKIRDFDGIKLTRYEAW